MSSLTDSTRESASEDEILSSVQLEALFDEYAQKFAPETSNEIICSMLKIESLNSNDNLSHLTHRIIALIYCRLTELIEKLVLTDDILAGDELFFIGKSLDFISKVFDAVSESLYDYEYEGDDEEEGKDESEDESDGNESVLQAQIISREKLCQDIIPLNDVYLKSIQSNIWDRVKNKFEIINKIINFFIQRHEINEAQLKFFKHDENLLRKFTEENKKIFNTFVELVNSQDGVRDYLGAIKQLDSSLLTKRDECLLFDVFNFILYNDLYTEEFRTKFCRNFWLEKYENVLKQVFPTVETENEVSLSLNKVKYLVTNLIHMQRTTENDYFFTKGQIQNSTLKEEYLSIVNLILNWFSNPFVLKYLMKDENENTDHENIFRLQQNLCDNTTQNVTISTVTCVILKFILMFINANGDCLTYVKHEKQIKELSLKLMNQIENGTSVKIYIYNLLGLLLDEKDIQNEINLTKEIIINLVNYIDDTNEKANNNYYTVFGTAYLTDLLPLLTTLKAFLQHNQLKGEFIEQNGLGLLIELAMKESWFEEENASKFDETKKKDKDVATDNETPKGVKKMYEDNQKATEEVQQLALECIFTITFNEEAVKVLRKNDPFMNYIRDLVAVKTKVENSGLKKAADGILWKLEKEDQFKKEQQTTSNDKENFDLMISYSWSDKPLAHQIFHYLTEHCNYRIWLDENEMSASLCQSMAQAIEKSKIILMCMSETYKKSENCRNEAEYARDRKKTIIPIKMKQVELDDWLGFIAAGKMYIDFAKADFEKAIHLLKAEIGRNEKVKSLNNATAKSECPNRTTSQTNTKDSSSISKLLTRPENISTDYQQGSIDTWSEQQVRNFLFDKKLDIMVLLTENMNGDELHDLWKKCQIQQECWLIFDRLNKELDKRYQQTLPISVFLRFLRQASKFTNTSFF